MTTMESTTVTDKALELCHAIADAPEFADAHEKIHAFLSDPKAKAVYGKWQEKGHRLHQMGHEGKKPSDADLDEFASLKRAVESNSVAAAFSQAESYLDDTFRTVTKLVQKTLQLGRVPTAEDLAESGCCNEGGCGCH